MAVVTQRRITSALLRLILLAACTSSACGGHDPTAASPVAPSPMLSLFQSVTATSAVLVGAGDIARCGGPGAEATAKLLDDISGTVFTTGDNAYMSGSGAEYQNCYGPTWGRHRARTRPVPGNHEYGTPQASAYFDYFGGNAGPYGLGYYTYTVASWLVIALDSEIDISSNSPQLQWLRDQLSSSRSRCTAVYWHRPLFTSGPNGRNPDIQPLWQVLFAADVDIVINGHDHLYERFAPQDPDGRPDPSRGIRQFIVGTGGVPLYPLMRTAANSEARASVWGVASFTLENGGYKWEFVPVESESFRDSGTGVCH